MQRLFSTFPQGLPGIGLLLLRATVALPLLQHTLFGVLDNSPPGPLRLAATCAALLLLIGLWTPVAGGLVAFIEIGLALSHPAERWTFVHLGALGIALAFLGPGAWSVDARLFGRKHIQIPPL